MTAPVRSVESKAAPAPEEARGVSAPSAASQRATGGGSASSSEAESSQDGFTASEEEGESVPWLSAFQENLGPKKPTYDKVWTNHRDAGTEAPTVKTRAELEGRLKGESKNTTGLLDLLERDKLADPRNLTYLDQIRSRLGPEKAEKALSHLREFYQREGNGASNQRLLQDTLHDLAIPSHIDQKDRGTCTMTSVQMKWAIEDPESYARCLTELHSQGSCKMPDGSTLTRNDSHQKSEKDERSLSVKYLSDSLMGSCTSIFSGHLGGYDSADPKASGRTSGETVDALNRIFPGQSYTNDTSFGSNRDTLVKYLEDDLARGRTVTASVPGHHILVVGIDKSGAEPHVIINTWGEQKKMSVADFQKYIRAVETVDDDGWDSRKAPAGQRTQQGDR